MGISFSIDNNNSKMLNNESGETEYNKLNENALFMEKIGTFDYDGIFALVKRNVKEVIKKERSGLGLILSDLPNTLGAYWEVSGNYIVMNQNLIYGLKQMGISDVEIKSYIYSILEHEYLHSLGYINEIEDRRMTAYVASMSFDKTHPVYKISTSDPWKLYPFLLRIPGGNGTTFKIVRNFDKESTSYIM